jgi:hypothetical protein
MICHRLCITMFFATTLVAACGDSKSSSPGSTTTITDFCNSIVQSLADVQSRCLGHDSAFWKDLYQQSFRCDGLEGRVSSGTISYDAQKARECLDQLAKLTCDLSSALSACTDAVIGKVGTGGTCAVLQGLSGDCAPGNYCIMTLTSCGGTCQAEAKVGASCASNRCEDGSSCQYSTDICLADVGEGQPCEGKDAAGCADGFYCEGGTTTTAGACRKKKTSGPCTSRNECANSYNCAGAEGSKSCSKSKVIGDTCTPGLGECYAYMFWCGSDGKCTDAKVQEGQTCGITNGDYISCASGLSCVYGSGSSVGTCQKGLAAGSQCTSSSACTGGTFNYCDSPTRTCVACD